MSTRTNWRPALRRITDRIVQPYVARIDEQFRALRAETAGTSPPASIPAEPPPHNSVSDRFHHTIHELRTLELERLAGEYERVLSVGANGAWYFEWFRQAVGEVDEHIGVEAFEAKPDDLPPYVRWVTDTADHMDHVDSGTVDLVFAGQTTEHLWAHELVGFLLEAHRVLREGGLLVLDSPNRRITEHLLWSHGGHTIELDASEMRGLLEVAGFDVEDVAGVWCCRFDNRVLTLEEGIDDAPMLTRRIALGRQRPDDGFVWWINARRSARAPRHTALERGVGELFAEHWDTRVSRGFFPGNGAALEVAPGTHRPLASTLPFPLYAGVWQVEVRLESGSWDDVSDVSLSIDLPGGARMHDLRRDAAVRDGDVMSWEFTQPSLMFTLALTLSIETSAPIVIAAPLRFTPPARHT